LPRNDRKIDTRVKIHLGGLLVKAGLDDLDPATLYGGLLALRRTLDNPDKQQEYIAGFRSPIAGLPLVRRFRWRDLDHEMGVGSALYSQCPLKSADPLRQEYLSTDIAIASRGDQPVHRLRLK
jgi:hypothetical protein